MWWSTSRGGIMLQITKEQASIGAHQGPCDADIVYLRTIPAIRHQLAKVDPDVLKYELKEYGAWDEDELADHDENLSRVLWLACGDIMEETN